METKKFPISRGSIIRNFLFRLIMIPLIIFILFSLMVVAYFRIPTSNFFLTLFLASIVVLGIIGLSFLRMTHDIFLDGQQLTFVSFIRNIRMEIGDLISIKDVKGGVYTKFKSKERSVLSLSNIKDVMSW